MIYVLTTFGPNFYGPSFWNIYPNISNGQRTQRIFDSYQNLDS